MLEKPAEQFARFPSVFDVTEEAVVVRDDPAWAQDDLVAAAAAATAQLSNDQNNSRSTEIGNGAGLPGFQSPSYSSKDAADEGANAPVSSATG